MAQFAAQGRVKLLFNGEGVALEQKGDPFNNNMFTSIQPHTYNRRLGRPHLDSTRLYSSSSMNKAKRLNAEARLFVGGDEAGPGHDDASEFERDDELACFRGLVLDISYRPVNVVCWKRAICLEYMEKADVLEYYDQTVNSPNGSFYIPAVLRVPHLLQIVKRRRIKNNLSRKNILCRDSFTCQYCSSRENLTIDHVLPIVRGGEWKWENLVRQPVH
ncbi:unnamed protein product [Prunus armeniaca]